MQKFLEWTAPSREERALAQRLDPSRLPGHVAVIMDGNGRWAKQRRLPRTAGHQAGVRPVRDTIEACSRLGIEFLTLYAFSAENWKRPKAEVDTLWGLLRHYLRKELPSLRANGVRFRTIGRVEDLPPEVRADLDYASRETAANTGMRLNIALNYSGRAEIVDAANDLLRQAFQRGEWRPVEESDLNERLYPYQAADPDLLIRTSGEFRLSNFLLWQIAYAEIWVTERNWPDFRCKDLLEALLAYQKRDRRYGGLSREAFESRAEARQDEARLLAVGE